MGPPFVCSEKHQSRAPPNNTRKKKKATFITITNLTINSIATTIIINIID